MIQSGSDRGKNNLESPFPNGKELTGGLTQTEVAIHPHPWHNRSLTFQRLVDRRLAFSSSSPPVR